MLFSEVELTIEIGLFDCIEIDDCDMLEAYSRYVFNHLTTDSASTDQENLPF